MKKINFLFTILFACFLTGQAQAQSSVMDYFNALQNDLKRDDMTAIITTKDINNGYLAYTHNPSLGYMIGGTESLEVMTYFTAKNGQKFVVTSALVKGRSGWAGQPPVFWELTQGTLMPAFNKYLSQEQELQILDVPTEEDEWFYTKLPQYGTTIQVGKIKRSIGYSSFKPVYELRFNTNNATFTLVKL